jgi:hypothetical protein
VYSVFVVIIFLDLFRFLTIGIRSLSLAKEGKICFLFWQNCFWGRKRGRRASGSYIKTSEMNLGKQIGYLNSSRKNTQFQKKTQPKQSSRSKVMSILNSIVFQGFSEKKRDFLP